MTARHPDPAAGYRLGRELTARHGRTYHLAAQLLPATGRQAVYALYGLARRADDLVDDDAAALSPQQRAAGLDRLQRGLETALSGPAGSALPDSSLPDSALPDTDRDLLAAVADTVERYRIDPQTFAAFFASMRADVPGTADFRCRYRSLDELAEYTYGSAAVIGRQLLPVLGADAAHARRAGLTPAELDAGAALLGEAFQLTNFLRDTGEDLRRDRIYLPADQLAAFGVDEALLRSDLSRGAASGPVRRALAHLIAVNRDQYRRCAPAIAALPRRTRPAIAAAAVSYAGILTAIEANGYDVFSRRATVPRRRRLGQAAAAVLLPGRTPAD